MIRATEIPAIGGGVMLRDARGRFAGVLRDAVPVTDAFRIVGGRVFTVTVLPDAPVPAWACKRRPIGKNQHGKRGGYRNGSREKWAGRATRLCQSMQEVAA